MRQKVVIIGHGYLSRLSLIRSVAEIGCDVSVVVMTSYNEHKKPIDCYSKYVNHYFFCDRKDKETLILLLLDKCTDSQQKVVLIPDGDDVVAAIDNNKDRLKDYFLFPHIAKEPFSMEYWMEKTQQKQVAKEIGLNVTSDVIVEIKDGQYSIPPNLQYPVFPKPLATMNGGKRGMRRCNNAKELLEALDFIVRMRSGNTKIIVEDYKQIETEYALLGFSDGNDVIIPGVLQFLVGSKSHPGIALLGKVVPLQEFEELVKKFKELVLWIGFVGVFDVDFFKSEGCFYFCEMNLRYGGSGYAITKMGVNLPAIMVQSFMGKPIDFYAKSIDKEAIYFNDKMGIDDLNNGALSLKDYNNYLKNSDIRFICDANDPLPERQYEKEYKKRIVVNVIKKMIRK